MDAHLLVRSKFMVSREFGTLEIPKEPLVTIETVTKPSEEEEATKGWWLLTFREPWAKPLKIITTHQQALILMFGEDTNTWTGKRIGLFAMVGVFFKKRQTAVRIKGSPDIKEPCSFSVRKWGGGRDTYSLVPMPDPAKSAGGRASKSEPTPLVHGIVWWGRSKGMQVAQLSPVELAAQVAQYDGWLKTVAPNTPGIESTMVNLDELRAEEKRREEIDRAIESGSPPA